MHVFTDVTGMRDVMLPSLPPKRTTGLLCSTRPIGGGQRLAPARRSDDQRTNFKRSATALLAALSY